MSIKFRVPQKGTDNLQILHIPKMRHKFVLFYFNPVLVILISVTIYQIVLVSFCSFVLQFFHVSPTCIIQIFFNSVYNFYSFCHIILVFFYALKHNMIFFPFPFIPQFLYLFILYTLHYMHTQYSILCILPFMGQPGITCQVSAVTEPWNSEKAYRAPFCVNKSSVT